MAIQLAKAITDLTDKMVADAVIDFINTYKTVEIDMQFLRRGARLAFVGLFASELKLCLVFDANESIRLSEMTYLLDRIFYKVELLLDH